VETNSTQMFESKLESTGIAGQNAYGPDIVFRTGGTISPNPVLPNPVILTTATERMRIANDGTVLFSTDTVSLPNDINAGLYFGVANTVGSWKLRVDLVNNLFLIQAFVGSSYVTKFVVSI
jgi:hypothetical protein